MLISCCFITITEWCVLASFIPLVVILRALNNRAIKDKTESRKSSVFLSNVRDTVSTQHYFPFLVFGEQR